MFPVTGTSKSPEVYPPFILLIVFGRLDDVLSDGIVAYFSSQTE